MNLPLLPNEPKQSPVSREEWRWQLQHTITTARELGVHLKLTADEQLGAERAERAGFPISVTPYYLGLIDPDDPNCPIRRQVVPSLRESELGPGDLRDPLGEEVHEVAPDLVQRYPDRVLLLVSDRCSVYCRFCTRSRMVGAGGGARSLERLEAALLYIRNHPEVSDVIISGGDPLVMSTAKLVSIVEAVRGIPSVQTIRLATRVPVTLPQRITTELLTALRPLHPLWVMTHFNHPKELTPEATSACRKLADAGFPVMNQTVLLRGINDDAATLTALFRGLVRERVRPYYLLQMDPVVGSSHLRTTVHRGRSLMAELQGKLSGIALPKYIVDTPGGFGKVPAGPSYVEREGEGVTTFRSPRGVLVDYVDPREDAGD